VITLYTFPGRDGLESMSPFCMKVEVYLKLQKLPYNTRGGNPRSAPKGKHPYITHDDGGPTVADSTAILEYLESKSKSPLDEGMSDEEKGRAWLLKRTFEEALYFVVLWARWVDDSGWAVVKGVFDEIPGAVRWAVAPLIRRSVRTTTVAQGTGRHSREEIYEMGKKDIDAIAELFKGPYFVGDRMRTIDVTAYAFLANIHRFVVDGPLKAHLKTKPELVAFIDRMAKHVDDAKAS